MVPSTLISMKKDKGYPRAGFPSYKNYKTISDFSDAMVSPAAAGIATVAVPPVCKR